MPFDLSFFSVLFILNYHLVNSIVVHRTDQNLVKHTLILFDLPAKLRRVFDSTKQK